MAVVRGGDLVLALAKHLLDHQHHDHDDEGVAGDDDRVEQRARRPLLILAHHVPHQHRPHHHVDRHPGKKEPPVRQGQDCGDDEPDGVLGAPHLVEEEEEADDEHEQFGDARGARRLRPSTRTAAQPARKSTSVTVFRMTGAPSPLSNPLHPKTRLITA